MDAADVAGGLRLSGGMVGGLRSSGGMVGGLRSPGGMCLGVDVNWTMLLPFTITIPSISLSPVAPSLKVSTPPSSQMLPTSQTSPSSQMSPPLLLTILSYRLTSLNTPLSSTLSLYSSTSMLKQMGSFGPRSSMYNRPSKSWMVGPHMGGSSGTRAADDNMGFCGVKAMICHL